MLARFLGISHRLPDLGYTDMRKSVDDLTSIVQQQFRLNPFVRGIFLFCGHRSDRLKNYHGYLHTDGYKEYNLVNGVTHCYC